MGALARAALNAPAKVKEAVKAIVRTIEVERAPTKVKAPVATLRTCFEKAPEKVRPPVITFCPSLVKVLEKVSPPVIAFAGAFVNPPVNVRPPATVCVY